MNYIKLQLYSLSFDISANMFGPTTCNNEPNGTPELSPVAGNDDRIEGAATLSNRMHDDADEDDFFSKRRYLF